MGEFNDKDKKEQSGDTFKRNEVKIYTIAFTIIIVVALVVAIVLGVMVRQGCINTGGNEYEEDTNNLPLQLPDKEHDENAKPLLLDLGASTCDPCIRLQAVLGELEEDYSSDVDIAFYNIYTDTGSQIAKAYNVYIIPTLIYIDAYGKEVKRTIGFQSYESIVENFELLGWI